MSNFSISVESQFSNVIRTNEINFDEGLEPDFLLKTDAFALQIYIQAYLISHSSSGEDFTFTYSNSVAKQRAAFVKKNFPDAKEIDIPVFAPDLSPNQYMNRVMRALKNLPDNLWDDKFMPLWLHDRLITQNLFRRHEYEEDDHKRPDPCLVIKMEGRKKDQYDRTFLAPFAPDIDTEQVCVELRRFLRFLSQQLGKSRLLNVITGYHSTLSRKSKTQVTLDTYVITTPLQLGIHAPVQRYVREFSPNRLFTIHLGHPLPGLTTLDNYVNRPGEITEPPQIDIPSPVKAQDETIEQTINLDRYNTWDD